MSGRSRKDIQVTAHLRRTQMLGLLLDRGVMRQTEIAEAMGLNPNQINDLTRSMRAEGLVDRSGLLGLTAKGLMVAMGYMDLRPQEDPVRTSRYVRPLVVARMMQLWDDGYDASEIARVLRVPRDRVVSALRRELGVVALPDRRVCARNAKVPQ